MLISANHNKQIKGNSFILVGSAISTTLKGLRSIEKELLFDSFRLKEIFIVAVLFD